MISVSQISSINPGNPFLGDTVRMGLAIGLNVTVMFSKFEDERHSDIVVVNTETGERIIVRFEGTK